MIDGINITLSISPDEIQRLLDFHGSYNKNTGEESNVKKPTAELNGLLFIIGNKPAVKVKGSVHKFANQGNHNHDGFTFSRFLEVVSELSQIISPLDQVHGIEFGVNLNTPFDPSLFIRNLIAIRGQRFSIDKNTPGKCYAESKFSQYVVKIYDKGLQYDLDYPVLRIELNYFKLARLFPDGLTWGQLSESITWKYLGKVLSGMFEEAIYWDPVIDLTNIPERGQMTLKEGYNPIFWERVKDNHGRKRKIFQGLIAKHGSNFTGIPDMIRQEINQLIDIPTPAKLTECYHFASRKNGISLSGSYKKMTECYPLLSCNNRSTSSPTYPEVRKCPVTGIDISHQKITSKFISENTIRWIYKSDREQYLKLQNIYLPSKEKNQTLGNQFYRLAHNVRNEYFNPKHNAIRDIEKVLSYPSLFDQKPYIRTDRRRLAGLDG